MTNHQMDIMFNEFWGTPMPAPLLLENPLSLDDLENQRRVRRNVSRVLDIVDMLPDAPARAPFVDNSLSRMIVAHQSTAHDANAFPYRG